jgi:3-hydroxybutyryl-CoA dehydrogenase
MIQTISVIGAGTMGNGIAHIFAQNNFKVTLIDVNNAHLENALSTISKNLDRQIVKGFTTEEQKQLALNNISTSTDVIVGVKNANLIIEAATEDIDIKLRLFKLVDIAAPPDCILATNTSSISVTKLASATKRPGLVIGMHFMNPVPVMKLVEIINGYSTTKEVSDLIVELSKKLGKIPCVVKDYPGFIANRILTPMINEAIYSLYEGVAGVEEIDTIMKLGMAHPMGPLRLADFIGLDVCLSILDIMHKGFGNPKYAPCPLLVTMVAAGKFGIKTGEGFYNYTAGGKVPVVNERFK